MRQAIELIPVRLYFHCGWAVQLDPSFEAEVLYGGETLFMFNPDHSREVFLSSMKFEKHDGEPWTSTEVCALFPRDLTGLHYDREHGDIAGHALWMFGEDDEDPRPSWVLVSMIAASNDKRIARCTVVCDLETDRDWALDVWRSVVRFTPPEPKA